MSVDAIDWDAFGRELAHELEADEYRLVMRQAKEYREETLASIRIRKRDPFACPYCYTFRAPVVSTREGDSVCTGCGLVLDNMRDDSGPDQRHRVSSRYVYPGYQHVFHFNERVANLACDDPAIPDDVFTLIEEAHWVECESRDIDDVWYDDVRRLLRPIEVPYEISEKYRGKRYKKLPLTDLDQKFSERWLTIRYRLTGNRPPEIDVRVRRALQLLFLGILPPFRRIRHKDGCDRRNKCHKHFGCSYKLPPYNFIIKELLFVHGGRELMDAYSRYLLHTTSSESLRKIRGMWDGICHANRWIASYHDDAEARRPKNLPMEV